MSTRARLDAISSHLRGPTGTDAGLAMAPTAGSGFKILIANRGEIAIRVARACHELDVESHAIFSEDDRAALHVRRADGATALKGAGPSAYLDINQIVDVAKNAGVSAIHPGYGFLSEAPDFARAVVKAGIKWIGPSPGCLDLFGDKLRARSWAVERKVPVVEGVGSGAGGASVDEIVRFFEASKAKYLPAKGEATYTGLMIKALYGGGGRGMRALPFATSSAADIRSAYDRCKSEATKAFGRGEVYAELLVGKARHIEVQVLGDGKGGLVHVWERECSVQRRNQKILELAPSPSLNPQLRQAILQSALQLLAPLNYAGLATVEYLVPFGASSGNAFFFMECNPRLQVEHTVTEEVTGMDLVAAQIRVCGFGESVADILKEFGGKVPEPRGFAVQLRVNMERIVTPTNAGDAPMWLPTASPPLISFDPPASPYLRIDHCGYSGSPTNPNFDSLLAKLIARGRTLQEALKRADGGTRDFRIEGVETTLDFLGGLVRHEQVKTNNVWTGWLDSEGWMQVLDMVKQGPRARYWTTADLAAGLDAALKVEPGKATINEAGIRSLGTQLGDLSAVLKALEAQKPAGTEPVRVPMQSTIVSMDVNEGDKVLRGQQIAVVEAMKMENLILAQTSGVIRKVVAKKGMTVPENAPILFFEPLSADEQGQVVEKKIDLDHIRPDLKETMDRQNLLLDAFRPDAVAKRRKTKQRTARENINQLVDPGSFFEWGGLALANQKSRRTMEWLLTQSPADGVVAGIANINGHLGFAADASRCLIFSYDYTVLAGTQGKMNHKKSDRVFEIAEKYKLPVVIFCEGGGGRPGDDSFSVAGLDNTTFLKFAKLSGLAPLVGIVSGRCFAGNAALLGCCDVIISTRDANIGMGGPAMIEGGGLGVFKPEEVGPTSVQEPNGVIDILVENEEEAVEAAKKYLSYFQGPVKNWKCSDQRILRHLIPENRLRVYDIREVIKHLADDDSVLELRPKYGVGMITAFIRIEGRPMGLIANDSRHLGGAIDGDDADKAARFIQVCDAYDIPVLSLCDTPGFMVGPEAEKTSLVRRVSRMFVQGANADIPFFCIILRKGYGLGAQAMAAGSFHAPMFTVSWPSGEFGGMGLEGAVRLAYRNELNAIKDLDERQAKYESMVASMYERGKALNMATTLEIDNVIDPAASRAWIIRGLDAAPPREKRSHKKRPLIDTW